MTRLIYLFDKAVEWCKERGFEFDAVNENVPAIITMFGADTRKIYADEYIDNKMCKRFDFPYSKKKRTIGNTMKNCGITDDEIKTIEDFITRTDGIIELRVLQAFVKMQYEVYRRLMSPAYVCKTNE